MRRPAVVAFLGTVLYVVTGCAAGDDQTAVPGPATTSPVTASTSPTAASTSPTATSGRPATRLTIVVSGPEQATRRYTLTCDPAGGKHPDPVAACAVLDRMDAPFAEGRVDRACTQVFGGPQVATVTGMLRGQPVDARFTRSDGCEIDRWDQHGAVLVERGGANGSAARPSGLPHRSGQPQ